MHKYPEGYFVARAGTHMLWRQGPPSEGTTYFETSEETDEVVRWHLTRGGVLTWLQVEAGLAAAEALQRMKEADLWYKSMEEAASKSPPAAEPSPEGKSATGP